MPNPCHRAEICVTSSISLQVKHPIWMKTISTINCWSIIVKVPCTLLGVFVCSIILEWGKRYLDFHYYCWKNHWKFYANNFPIFIICQCWKGKEAWVYYVGYQMIIIIIIIQSHVEIFILKNQIKIV
jgi:hypothetical protein